MVEAGIGARIGRTGRRLATGAGAFLAFLLLSGAALGMLEVPAYLLPPPSLVASEFSDRWPWVLAAARVTGLEILAGYALAILVSLPLAILIAGSPLVERTLYPSFVFSQIVPKIAIAPLSVVRFGFGFKPLLLPLFVSCFLPIVVGAIAAFKSFAPDVADLGRSTRAGPWPSSLEIRLPQALSGLFDGLEVGAALAATAQVAADFVARDRDLGCLSLRHNGTLETAMVLAVVISISLMGSTLYGLVELIGPRGHLLARPPARCRRAAAQGASRARQSPGRRAAGRGPRALRGDRTTPRRLREWPCSRSAPKLAMGVARTGPAERDWGETVTTRLARSSLGVRMELWSCAARAPANAADKASFGFDWYLGGLPTLRHWGVGNGCYGKKNVEPSIEEGRGSVRAVQVVGAEGDTFGTAGAGSPMIGVASGTPLKAVLLLPNTSGFAIISLEKTGIRGAKDLEGRKLAVSPGDALTQLFPAVVKANGLDQSRIELVFMDPPAKVPATLEGRTDALSGWTDEQFFLIETQGHEAAGLRVADSRVNTVGRTIHTHEDVIRDQPDLVRRFVEGTVCAREAARIDPDAAVAAASRVEPDLDRDSTKKQLLVDLELVGSPASRGKGIDYAAAEDRERTKELPVQYRDLNTDRLAISLVTNEFLPQRAEPRARLGRRERPRARPGGAAEPGIHCHGIAATFRRGAQETHVLGPIDLEVAENEFLAIVGPSGCGKSTFLRLVAGLLPPSAGWVRVAGREVAGPVTELGIVFQKPVLLPWRDLLGNVLVQIELRGGRTADRRERARTLLAAVGLKGFEGRSPHELSGGMQQRAALARALLHDPPLLLMDEPFGALDALTREQLRLDLEELWLGARKTVLFITHSIDEAVLLADRVVVMSPRPGRIERIVPVGLPRPRGLAGRTDPAFERLTGAITEIFLARGVLHGTGRARLAAGTARGNRGDGA